jgi:CAAX protease family protein
MSMLSATYSLPGLKSSPSTPAVARQRPWGFWSSFGWASLAIVILNIVGLASFYIFWTNNVRPPSLIYVTTSLGAGMSLLIINIAARRVGWAASDYLGLVRPDRRQFLVGLGLLVVFWVCVEGVSYFFPQLDQSESVNASQYRTAAGSITGLLLFWLYLVVTAPVTEEAIFRGFLFRGWAQSGLGVAGTLLLTSLIFAAMHMQYNLAGMVQIFGLGLLLAVVRWRSGSTVLVILMHSAWNAGAGILTALSL